MLRRQLSLGASSANTDRAGLPLVVSAFCARQRRRSVERRDLGRPLLHNGISAAISHRSAVALAQRPKRPFSTHHVDQKSPKLCSATLREQRREAGRLRVLSPGWVVPLRNESELLAIQLPAKPACVGHPQVGALQAPRSRAAPHRMPNAGALTNPNATSSTLSTG